MVSISKEQIFKGAGLLLAGAASYWALNKFCGKRWKVLQHPVCKVGVVATPLVLGMVYSNKKGFVAKLEDEIAKHKGNVRLRIAPYTITGKVGIDVKINKKIAHEITFYHGKQCQLPSRYTYAVVLGKEYRNIAAKKLCEKVVLFLLKRNLTFRLMNMPTEGKNKQPTRHKVILIYAVNQKQEKPSFWSAPIEGLKNLGMSEEQVLTYPKNVPTKV